MKNKYAGKMLIAAGFISLLSGCGELVAQARSGKPNFLFFFPDQFRADWTSMNAAMPNVTPNLKKIADRGVRFTSAICPAPLCAPSRACLATGKQYDRCGVMSNGDPLPLDEVTFYKLLRDSAGYHVLGCGKFDLDKPGANWGADGKHLRGDLPSLLEIWGFSDGIDNAGKGDGATAYKKQIPEPYYAYLKEQDLLNKPMTDQGYTDNWIAGNGLKLLRSVPPGEPWFLQINFNGPHGPYDPTPSMMKDWAEVILPSPKATAKEANDIRQRYSAEVFNIDRWIKIFAQELELRGEKENTIIVFCSDHGDMLGDHGFTGKDKPYHPSVAVPLIISGPGIKKNLVNSLPAATLDLTATFLDYAGIRVPSQMDSKSLRPILDTGENRNRNYVTSARGNWRMTYDGRYKLIDSKNGEKVLYDLQSDPAETINLARERDSIVKRLEVTLPSWFPVKNKSEGDGATTEGRQKKISRH